MVTGAERVARARACIGARFRPHGRAAAYGLDCVGVAAIAFGRAVAGSYTLRGGEGDALAARIDALGLKRVAQAGEGDLMLIEAGMGQWHLAVATGDGFVHADARLRRVVETPGRPQGAILAWTEGE